MNQNKLKISGKNMETLKTKKCYTNIKIKIVKNMYRL